MKKNIFIYLLVILLSTLLLTGCTKKVEEEKESDTTVTEEKEQEQQTEEEVEEDLGYLSDPSEFTNQKQTLGVASTFEYTVESITATAGDGYHDFRFSMSSTGEGATVPLFTLEPLLTKGVVRVTLVNILKDTSTVSHTKGIVVDKGAITSLIRVVTSAENTRIYDIGVLGSNTFKLEMVDSGEGSWEFSIKVAYDTKYSAPTVDYGSTEFSSEAQSIEGMTSTQSAKVTNYSYLLSGGVVKLSFEVSSGASNPIPSVNGEYDDAGILVVTFPSLVQDKVSGWANTISLPAGITASVSRSGESSTYRFSGISNKKPFKLSASQSPNLVIVEIDI